MGIAVIVAILLLAWTQPALAGESAGASFPVPAIAIQTGDVIGAEMIVERRFVANATALRTHHTARESVIGKVARRPLPAGAAIPLNAVREAHAFKEGERVTVEYASSGLSIRGAGIALQPGVVGALVRVRNADTGVVVSGVVRPDGSVEVGG